MKTAVDCLPCYLRQALQVARTCSAPADRQYAAVAAVAALLSDLDMEQTPPANAIRVYAAIAQATGCLDPYLEKKKKSNEQALRVLPLLRREVARADMPLALAIRLSIAGNIIDYGAAENFDLEGTLARCRHAAPVIDHLDQLLAKIAGLQPSARILYLADNCGEIVYDRLVIELLAGYGLQLTVAVKSGPIINDALQEDATACGLERYATIITNGTACPGTPLPDCSAEFRRCFAEADLVISKGQGNFETLSEVEREIFFLLTVKCPVVGRHLADLTGRDVADLPGRGEMVAFSSRVL